MAISRIKLKNFTAFEEIDLEFASPGINVFIGANATGKTHLMKVIYAACDITKSEKKFVEKLTRVFMPSGGQTGRLVRRKRGSNRCDIEVARDKLKLKASFSNHATSPYAKRINVTGEKKWLQSKIASVYIPVKEMLSNAPGFRALYGQRDLHFEEVYADILDRAYLPRERGRSPKEKRDLLDILQNTLVGTVIVKQEAFFLKNKQGMLEFSLLAEGMRKLGLLWLLIQNGVLLKGSILFWDEPETNLNPRLYGTVIEVLLALQREGVQIFLATHDYVILKELELRAEKNDKILYHALYKNRDSSGVQCRSTANCLQIEPNVIQETFADLFNRTVEHDLDKK